MQANVSVLAQGVTVPATTLPFDTIPGSYRAWYKAIFDQGMRCPPPARWDAPIVIMPVVHRVPQGTHFEIEELKEFDSDIVAVTRGVVVTKQGIVVGGQAWLGADAQVGGSPNNHRPLGLTRVGCKATVFDLTTGHVLASDLPADAVMACEGRMYLQSGAALFFLEVIELPAKTIIQPRLIANVLPHATALFEGVAMQSILGAWYASILGPNGKHYQKRVIELDGSEVVEAKYQNRVLMVVARRGGVYERLILRFDDAHTSYDVRRIENISSYAVNFTTLENGICLYLNDQDELEVFSNRRGAQEIKVIADPAIDGGCKLFKNGSQVLFARGSRLYKISMKVR